MIQLTLMTKKYLLLFSKIALMSLTFVSCKNNFIGTNDVAYFGGEVEHPTSRFILFCKDGEVLDTIPLKKDNTFIKKMDSLPAGLYSFKNEPEYQYVYFDKNDSIMVHIDSYNFDESIVFCGNGGEKNNFLIEMFIKNEKDKNDTFDAFDLGLNKFNAKIDAIYNQNSKLYQSKKDEISWNSDFDVYAQALVNLPYYSKKEIYPIMHQLRTGNDAFESLPKNYYSYREKLDFSNDKLIHFSPYTSYINTMLTNSASLKYHNHFSEVDVALKTGINKLKIADTLIKNEKVKNAVLNSVAFQYLLEDQNMVNVNEFLSVYKNISTDKSKKNEITKLGNSIQFLTVGKKLPNVQLADKNGSVFDAVDLIDKNTVFFFWTDNLQSHFEGAHKKAVEFQKKYPETQFISINIDSNINNWKTIISKKHYPNIKEFHCKNFEELKTKWAITKIHRTIIVNKNKTIKNGFSNMFDVNFEKELR